MDERFPICGTARREMERAGANAAFRQGARAAVRGHIDVAERRLREALAHWADGWDMPPQCVPEALLAAVLDARGDHAAARALYADAEAASTLCLADLGPTPEGDDVWRARHLRKIADVDAAFGRFAEAERGYREAIGALGRCWGDEHLETGTYKDDLATLLLRVCRDAEADALVADARRAYAASGFRYPTEAGVDPARG